MFWLVFLCEGPFCPLKWGRPQDEMSDMTRCRVWWQSRPSVKLSSWDHYWVDNTFFFSLPLFFMRGACLNSVAGRTWDVCLSRLFLAKFREFTQEREGKQHGRCFWHWPLDEWIWERDNISSQKLIHAYIKTHWFLRVSFFRAFIFIFMVNR